MANQTVLILDFGGQYKELIARRVRECKVFSLIKPYNMPIDEIRAMAPIGIILTGGPNSVYEDGAYRAGRELFELGIPVLGICYGMQLMSYVYGGKIQPCKTREYGLTRVALDATSALFSGVPDEIMGLMSHTDQVTAVPEGFRTIAHTRHCPNAGMENAGKRLYGVQFHPETENTSHGLEIIRNFLYNICGAKGDYDLSGYVEEAVATIRAQVGTKKVVLGLSGGVDSSVCAALLARAVPGQLTCIFVDHGLMRKNEGDEIEAAFGKFALNFVRVNAEDRFLTKLAGVTEPERKRRIIGEEFVRVFEGHARGTEAYLAQGTIYPDVVESGQGASATIKSHHNVGGLPTDIAFLGLVEPLRGLFKDEVRALGAQLGLPAAIVQRQPFPGPGLAIRCIGEITKDKLGILREADAIFREEVVRSRTKADQFFAVLTDTRSVGVMGDFRTYGYTVALRAVITTDFMTCEYAPLSHKLLGRVSSRIVNEVPNVSRVVYDITGKPPATIEWE
jgi:GMP synthase (glutamine-hydrolysing)